MLKRNSEFNSACSIQHSALHVSPDRHRRLRPDRGLGGAGAAAKRGRPAASSRSTARRSSTPRCACSAADDGGTTSRWRRAPTSSCWRRPSGRTSACCAICATRVRGDAIVTDVGSTKRAMVDAARHLPRRLRFVGGHPLAGAATGGIEAARADLFRGRPWILTPDRGEPATRSGRAPQRPGVGRRRAAASRWTRSPTIA